MDDSNQIFTKKQRAVLEIKLAVALIRKLESDGKITHSAMRKIEKLADKEIEKILKT